MLYPTTYLQVARDLLNAFNKQAQGDTRYAAYLGKDSKLLNLLPALDIPPKLASNSTDLLAVLVE